MKVETRRRIRFGRRRVDGVEPDLVAEPEPLTLEGPEVDIAPNDPVLAYFQGAPGAVELDKLEIDSPGVRALKEAGVKLVVPLVTQGELIGLLNLGPRLSEQEYSADDRKLLENLAGQAAPALRVAQLVREQEIEIRTRERYEQELRVATLIQQNFLPHEPPDLPGFELAAFYRPAREVSGDFYDFIELDDGRVGIVCGDVTDKGVPAALVMASTRSILRGAATRDLSPGEVLERVNELVCPEMPEKMFVTCLYGILDPATGRFVYANAGHDIPYKVGSGAVEELRARGMPLGLMEGMTYEQKEAVVAPGETVFFSSDGLIEAHAPNGEMFGCPRVMALVAESPGGAELMDVLLSELHRFTGPEWVQEDDITMVTLRRSASAYEDGPVDEIISFELPSEPGNERDAMDRVADAVGGIVPADRLERLKTAVAEATMNAIEHGNDANPELPVRVRVTRTAESLSVCIVDFGGGKDIPEDTAPDIEAKLAGEQTPRGWGLFLIRNMVDEMHVSADEIHHTIELVLHLGDSEKGA